MFPVFIEGGGADAAQLPPGQGRLEHVRGIHGTFGGPGTHNGVYFIDEEDDFPFRVDYLLENGLETFLEFAPIFGPGDQGAYIEADDPFIFQIFGYVPVDDPLGQPLDDSRFSHSGLTDQNGVVLGPPGEDLHDPPDFLVPADDGIEATFPRYFIEIFGVAFEGLVFILRIRVRYPLFAPDVHEDLEDTVLVDADLAKNFRRRPGLLFGHGDEEMLGADVFIFQAGGFGHRLIDDLVQPGTQIGRRRCGTFHPGQFFQ